MSLESYHVIEPKQCILIIGINTRRAAAGRDEEEMDNVGDHDNQVTLQDNKVPPFEEFSISDQVLLVPPPITDGERREDFINFDQVMTSQDNFITSQVQG